MRMHRDGFGFGLGFFEEMGLTWSVHSHVFHAHCICTDPSAQPFQAGSASIRGCIFQRTRLSLSVQKKYPVFQTQLVTQRSSGGNLAVDVKHDKG